MTLLLVLDAAHAASPLFMKAFGQALQGLKTYQVAIVHTGGAYTEQLIQTGLMRREAEVRAQRETNRKLITWLADYGLACSGLHGDQRGLVRRTPTGIQVNALALGPAHAGVVRICSTLIVGADGGSEPLPLAEAVRLWETHLPADQVVVYRLTGDAGNPVPEEMRAYAHPYRLTDPFQTAV